MKIEKINNLQINDSTKTIDICNNILRRKINDKLMTLGQNNNPYFTKNNIELFQTFFGKSDGVIKSEFNSYYYNFKINDEHIITIYTGKKGTSYELHIDFQEYLNSKKLGLLVLDFLKFFEKNYLIPYYQKLELKIDEISYS